MQSTPERPRFRNDLVAQPIEEEGVRYVDVTDPRSGSTFRFYDVEYSIACAMDGARDLDNLADWTRTELGIEASLDELVSVVNTLAELGYLELEEHGEFDAEIARDHGFESYVDEAASGVDSTPDDMVAHNEQPLETTEEDGEFATEVPSANIVETALVTEPNPPRSADEEGGPPASGEAETSFAGLLDEQSVALSSHEASPADSASRSGPPVRSSAQLDDDGPTQVPTSMVDEDEQDGELSVDLSAHLALDRDEVKEAVRSSRVHAVPDLSPDLQAALSDDDPEAAAREQETARAIREATAALLAPDAPAIPTEADERPPETALIASAAMPAAATIPLASSSSRPIGVAAPSTPVAPLAPPPSLAQTRPAEPVRPVTGSVPARPVEPLQSSDSLPPRPSEPIRPAPAVTLPSRPPGPATPRGVARPSRPIEPTKTPPPAKAPSKSSWGTVLIILGVAGLVFGVTYFFQDRIFGSDDYKSEPHSGTPTKPSDNPADKPGELTAKPADKPTEKPADKSIEKPADKSIEKPADKSIENPAPTALVRADAASSVAVTVKAVTAGDVVWSAEKGATVEAGAPLVKLFGVNRWEAKLRDGTDRGAFYAKKLADAQARGDTAAAESAQRKVDEKKQIVEESTKELAKLVVTAPSAGKIKQIAAAGATLKVGDTLAEIVGDSGAPASTLRASFLVGAGASSYTEGGPAVVAAKSAPEKQFTAIVEKVFAGKVEVRIVAVSGSTTAAPGDEVTLLPPKK